MRSSSFRKMFSRYFLMQVMTKAVRSAEVEALISIPRPKAHSKSDLGWNTCSNKWATP